MTEFTSIHIHVSDGKGNHGVVWQYKKSLEEVRVKLQTGELYTHTFKHPKTLTKTTAIRLFKEDSKG